MLCPLLVASQRGSDQPHPGLPSWALSDGLKLSRGQTWYQSAPSSTVRRQESRFAPWESTLGPTPEHMWPGSGPDVSLPVLRSRVHVPGGSALSPPLPSQAVNPSPAKRHECRTASWGVAAAGAGRPASPFPSRRRPTAHRARRASPGLACASCRFFDSSPQSSPPQRRGDRSTERARDLLGVTQPVRAGTGLVVPLHTRAFAHAILLRAHCAPFRVRTTDFSSVTRF